jgi:hypothetical protein
MFWVKALWVEVSCLSMACLGDCDEKVYQGLCSCSYGTMEGRAQDDAKKRCSGGAVSCLRYSTVQH